jgi:Na+-driven multidrug efflux pump
MFFFGMLMVLMAAFHGSGHNVPAMMVTFLRWAIRLSLAAGLGFSARVRVGVFEGRVGAGMGSTGIYVSMAVANLVCSLVLLAIFFRGGWQSTVIDDEQGPEDGEEAVSRP